VPDATFGTGGVATVAFGTDTAAFDAVAVQSDGAVVAAGGPVGSPAPTKLGISSVAPAALTISAAPATTEVITLFILAAPFAVDGRFGGPWVDRAHILQIGACRSDDGSSLHGKLTG
jgi:hypothetical protein